VTLQVENLTIYYQTLRGEVHALESTNFRIEDHEIMGLAGESGCGKTTLGTSLVLLKPPMKFIAGRVILDNEELPIQDMEGMNPFRFKKLSIIPQYAMNALNPTRKIGKMTAEFLRSRNVDFQAVWPVLKERLDLVELPETVLGMYPMEMSGGMKQRMVMVLSTLLNPSLLIADEITSALDVATQKAVVEMLVEFRNNGCCKSAIVITHDLSILYQIADSILIMYAGQLAEKAPTATIIQAPRHPYTRLLISSLPRLGARYAQKRLTGIPGSPPQLLTPPRGCRFGERCPDAFEKCQQEPPFVEVEKGHFLACWKDFDSHALA
jgi:peptide/nickel transport system ATP-binding protein